METNRRTLPTNLPEHVPTGLTCIACKTGTMVAAVDEGEPDYTDHYRCLKCGHHANIPMLGIILSQLATGIVGIALVSFLMLNQLMILFERLETQSSIAQPFALLSLGFVFQIGFLLACGSAVTGLKTRRIYRAGKV